jgi:predicted GNAT family acetyltransferase
MDLQIEHDRAAQRFTTVVDGHRAVVDYQLDDGVMAIMHTGVPGPIEGRGIAGALTRAALDTARAEGWRVVARCAYAAAYLRRHPGDADLLA